MSFPNRGEGGGVPHLGKIPTFSRFFFWGSFPNIFNLKLIYSIKVVFLLTFGGLQSRSWKSANCGNRIYSWLKFVFVTMCRNIHHSFIFHQPLCKCSPSGSVSLSLQYSRLVSLSPVWLFTNLQENQIETILYITIDIYNLHVLHLSRRMVLMKVLCNSNHFIYVFLEKKCQVDT